MPSIFSFFAPIHPTPTYLGGEGYFLNLIKGSCSKSIANIFNGERLNIFPLRWRTRQECPLSPLLFNIILEILASATRQEKRTKVIQIRKEAIKLSLFAYDMRKYTGLA